MSVIELRLYARRGVGSGSPPALSPGVRKTIVISTRNQKRFPSPLRNSKVLPLKTTGVIGMIILRRLKNVLFSKFDTKLHSKFLDIQLVDISESGSLTCNSGGKVTDKVRVWC